MAERLGSKPSSNAASHREFTKPHLLRLIPAGAKNQKNLTRPCTTKAEFNTLFCKTTSPQISRMHGLGCKPRVCISLANIGKRNNAQRNMPEEKTEQDVERRIALAGTPIAPIQTLCARSEFETKNKSNSATRKIEPPHTHLDVTSKRFIQSKVQVKKNFRATKKMCHGTNFAKCKKNSRWRRVRRRTLPTVTTPSPYASKLLRPNPPRSEQNCAEPSSLGNEILPNETQRESKEQHPSKIHPKPKENRPRGEFCVEPSPRRQHPRHTRANYRD